MSELGADFGDSSEEDDYPLALALKGKRERSRTPARVNPEQQENNSNQRAASSIPPADDFDPLDLDALVVELTEELRGRERFERLKPHQLVLISTLFVRYGFFCIKDIKRTQEKARNCFVDDLRRKESVNFLLVRYILAVFDHLTPENIRNNKGKKDPFIEEICIPSRMSSFTWDMSGLASIFLPDQEMANAISLEIARANNTVPSYNPYIIPTLADKPWVVPTADHTIAITRWRENTRDNKKRNKQEISFQCWITYQMRFIITAHLCKAFDHHGGISSQFNHLAVCINMAVVESVATAISYDRLVKTHLQAIARRREQNFDYVAFLKKENQEFKRKAIAENVNNRAPPPKGKGKEGKGQGFEHKGYHPRTFPPNLRAPIGTPVSTNGQQIPHTHPRLKANGKGKTR